MEKLELFAIRVASFQRSKAWKACLEKTEFFETDFVYEITWKNFKDSSGASLE